MVLRMSQVSKASVPNTLVFSDSTALIFLGGFFLINVGSGFPLRIDSNGRVSVSAQDCRDAFACFALDPEPLVPGSFHIKSVGAGKAGAVDNQ